MTVYLNRDRDRWVYDFQLKGKRHAGYCLEVDGAACLSRRTALRAEARAKEKAALAPKLPSAGDYTLTQALAALTPSWERQDDFTNKKRYMRELLEHFGPATAIAAIGEHEIRTYIDFARSQPKRIWCGGPNRDPADASNARFWRSAKGTRGPRTTNLYLNVLRQALAHAAKLRDPLTGASALSYVPVVKPLSVPKRRARPVPDDVLSEIMPAVPIHIEEAITATLYFGFRKGEVFWLTIGHVDFGAGGVRLDAADVKDDEDAFLPGAPQAMAFLKRLVDQARERGTQHLITWRPYRKDPAAQAKLPFRPIKSPKRAWSTAMKAIEKKHGKRWRWHDIRASFITQVAMTSGAVAAQALARHSRYETTEAYVDVADEARRTAANRAADRPALSLVGKTPKREPQTASTRPERSGSKALK